MNAAEATEWFDFFVNIINQPLHVILIIIIGLQWYGLSRLGLIYIKQGKLGVRVQLLLAMMIAEADETPLEQAEDRAKRMIDRGSLKRE